MRHGQAHRRRGVSTVGLAPGLVLLWTRTADADDGLLPHAACYLWDRTLIALHALTDSMMGLAYVAICGTLTVLVYRGRREIPFHGMALAFGLLFAASAATQFMEVWTVWEPRHWLAGFVKVVTAVASVITAMLLPPLVPRALGLLRDAKASAEPRREIESGMAEPQRAEALYRGLLESAPDAIVIVSEGGRIRLVNGEAERMFGYRRDELVDRPVEMLLPVRFREAHVRHRGRYDAGPWTRPMGSGLELAAVRKDGSEIPVEISLSPTRTEEGVVVTSVIRDISERKRMEAERAMHLREQAARVEADAENRAKDSFLATLSHELRTPLQAILGWAHLVRDVRLDPEMRRRALSTIERNARAQARLIEDLLDVSRIISGKLRLHVRPVELPPVIEAALETVRPAADAKGIALTSVLDPEAGPVSGDLDRLQQAVWNLLSNAIKFTPKGGRVQVRLERVDSHVEITVSDTGQGIVREFLPHIFERFRQADSSLTRQHGGLGLGLSIVRHVVELHGGTVHVDSGGEGRGATFSFRLPLTVARREPGEPPRLHPTAEPAAGEIELPRLDDVYALVVDDEPDARDLLATLLASYGARVTTVASARAALETLAATRPDVLLSDVEMPGEDGYELMRRVRGLPADRGRHIPAAALTAYAREEDRRRALSAGYDLHLAKPVSPAELVTAVASLVGRSRRQ